MRMFRVVGWIFAAVALTLLTIAGVLYYRADQFSAAAIHADGVVERLTASRSSDDTTWAAVVRFTDRDGREQQFTESMRTNPPRFAAGAKVPVLYDPQNPTSAVVADFWGRFGALTIVAGVAAPFLILAVILLAVSGARSRRNADLLRRGQPVEADFLEVFQDTRISVNGANPFRVVAQAADPLTGKLRRFESEPVWVDLSGRLRGRKVRVLVDPMRPERHLIDLSAFADADAA